MAKQTFTTGQVLTAAQMNSLQSNDFNQTVSVKTAAYTLEAADKGTRIEFNTSGSVTCTVNTGLFDAGDTVVIQNRGAGDLTVTAGTATVNTAGSLVISQYQSANLYFISSSASILFAGAVGDLTAVTSGTGISISNAGGPIPTITNSMATEITAAGDIVVGTGSGTFDNLPIGTTGQILTADTTVSPYKVKWQAASGGDYVKLAASTFSAVSSHSVNDVFSSTYKFYDVFVEFDSSSGSPEVSIRLRVSGSDATTNYGQSRTYFYGPSTTGVDNNAGLGTDEIQVGGCVTGYATQASTRIVIGTPFDATATNFQFHAQQFNGSSYVNVIGGGSHSTATSYTGFTLIASTGTMNGTVYVYGVKA